MNKKILFGIPTIALAAGYVISDNEFKLAFDRDFIFPKFISGSNKESEEKKEMKTIQNRGLEFFKGLDSEYVTIRNDKNNVITANFIPSKNKSKKYMILSHGFRNEGLREFASFIPFYYEEGVNLLIIDHQAHGSSEGKYITYGYQEHLDLLRWVQYLVQNYGEDIEVYLHGISMGAATVCLASGNDSLSTQVKGIISDCAFASAKEQICKTMTDFHTPLTNISYKLIAKKLEAATGAILDQVLPIEAVKKCKVPITFIHGLKDGFVPSNNAVRLFDACGCDEKDLILIEKAGHAQSYLFDKDKYQQAILDILHI